MQEHIKKEQKFWVQIVDYLVCSEDFARDYCGMEKIEEKDFPYVLDRLKELNKNTIIVTLGEKRIYYGKRWKS